MHKNHNSALDILSYFPLMICNVISCKLYYLITARGISTKLRTFVKHIWTTCHAQEPYLLHVYFSNYFPCNMTKCNFVIFLFLKGGDICCCFFIEKQSWFFIFFFVKIFFQEHYQGAKWFGSRSGPMFCWS